MSSTTKPRVLILGGGRMGAMRRELMEETNAVHCVGIVEVFPAARERLCAEGVTVFETLEAAAEKADFEAVWCCSPTAFHPAQIAAAAALGKHIYCEKPIAFTTTEIDECYASCEAADVRLFCGWMRRFDQGFREAHKRANADWVHLRIVSRDNPMPSRELLPQLGDVFQDLLCHDVNLALWFAGENEMPVAVYATALSSFDTDVLDNAYATLEFPRGRVVTIEASRFSPDGYDQRIELLTRGTEKNVVSGTEFRPFSFPQRYRQAFGDEVRHFGEFLTAWKADRAKSFKQHVPREHDVMTQRVVQALRTSFNLRRRVTLAEASGVRLRFVGEGQFGAFVKNAVLLGQGQPSSFALVEPSYTRSSGLEWQRDVLNPEVVDAVYVCSPDALHFEHADACVRAGMHVLVEKPVGTFHLLKQQAIARGVALMVGFMRRFDAQFAAARQHVMDKGADNVHTVVVESRDPVPACEDMKFVLANSCSHDLDMVNWLLPHAQLTVDSASVTDLAKSGLLVKLTATHASGGSTAVEIRYSKCHPTYQQQVHIDGATFGYNHHVPADEPFCALYTDAYRAQFAHFAKLAAGEVDRSDALLHSYARTFSLVDSAIDMLA